MDVREGIYIPNLRFGTLPTRRYNSYPSTKHE